MTYFSSASDESSESSGPSSEDVPKAWCRVPKSYLLVFVTNAVATAVLRPQQGSQCAQWTLDDGHGYYQIEWCTRHFELHFFFFGLMLSAFGAGCIAAFLLRRFHSSSHTKSACGYALVNWLQAMLGSLGMTTVMDNDYSHRWRSWRTVLVYCRLLLYVISLLWMQALILSRLDFLERSSSRKYGSRCFRRLVLVQVIGAAALTLTLGGLVIYPQVTSSRGETQRLIAIKLTTLMTVFPAACLCNVVASILAISSFSKAFCQLRRIWRLANGTDAPTSAKSALQRTKRLAGWQAVGVSFSLVFSFLLVPACLVVVDFWHIFPWSENVLLWVGWLCFFIQFLDPLGNAFAVLLLSGSHRLTKTEPSHNFQWPCGPKACGQSTHKLTSDDPNWTRKVEELAQRGMTLRSLLQFYQLKMPMVQGWTYVPEEHKTKDVVRRVIIPLTSREECAYAVSGHNQDGQRRPQVMVTHNWANRFNDLLAAVLADALQECSFNLAARLLQQDAALLQQLLGKMGRMDATYWICAFAVNQHATICHSNLHDRDPLTNLLHPVCNCGSVNISDPDGRSVESEVNKFDDMMYHLATTGKCRQVIAVDQSLDLFHRAWCVAEIAEARRLQMDQSLKLASKATLREGARTLEKLDVRDMQASCERDKELILARIEDVDDFNAKVQALIWDPKSGLVASWAAMDSLQQIGEAGRLIKWGLADAGSGRVWKAWETQD